MVPVVLVLGAVSDGVGNFPTGTTDRANVVHQNRAPDQAVVILEGVSHVELLVLSIVFAEYAEVVLRPVRSKAAAAG